MVDFANRGGHVIGICNGFQILCETGLLPGVLIRNASLTYICRQQPLKVATADSAYTNQFKPGDTITVPIAHHDGNYAADAELVARLKGEDRVAFTYDGNPNGSVADIAGILSDNRRVLGMMPHPERADETAHGNTDGANVFASLVNSLQTA